jgi:hypothetical protein|tara:strand:- start:298 stop:546 length:249 start_codon:yes stop_codon:yes gene_type:complete
VPRGEEAQSSALKRQQEQRAAITRPCSSTTSEVLRCRASLPSSSSSTVASLLFTPAAERRKCRDCAVKDSGLDDGNIDAKLN